MEYMLEREMPANYQNGNTKRAFTINQRKWVQVAMSDDLKSLQEFAFIAPFRPMRIIDKALNVIANY